MNYNNFVMCLNHLTPRLSKISIRVATFLLQFYLFCLPLLKKELVHGNFVRMQFDPLAQLFFIKTW